MSQFQVPPVPPVLPAPRKRKSRAKLWIIIGSIVALAVVLLVVTKAKSGGQQATVVTVEKAQVRTITQLVTATGKVQPETEVRISSEVAGELIEIPVLEGQTVKKGDVLARIKADFYQAQVDQAEASLGATRAASVLSRARLVKAQSDFKQSSQLWEKQLISEAEFVSAKSSLDVAQADYDSSLAQIRRSEGSLNQVKDQISKTTVFAPMDGTISSLTSKVGERVLGTGQFAGTEIMRLADLNSMEVRVKVNENDIVNVKLNDKTTIAVDAFPARRFKGAVREISSSALSIGGAGSNAAAQAASASDEVTNFLVKIRITEVESQLRPGMSATIDIETQTVENVVSVPVQSVTVRADGGKTSEEMKAEKAKEMKERSGNDLEVAKEKDMAKRDREKYKRVVFIREGEKVRMAPVETGIADNSFMEIKSGVKEGEEVVSGTYKAISQLLKNDMTVRIEKPKTEEKKP